MSALVTIGKNDMAFQRDFNSLVEGARKPRAIMMGVGREAGQFLKRHFREKDRKEPNSLSPRRTHYWREVELSVAPPIAFGDTEVRVGITHPTFAQKLFGGPIFPKAAKALTKPVSEEAYGRTAATFEAETGLKLFLIRSGDFAALATKRAEGSKFLQIEFLLLASVFQKPTPGALPDMSEGSPFKRALLARGQAMRDRENQILNAKN